jgi:hypothetical protein
LCSNKNSKLRARRTGSATGPLFRRENSVIRRARSGESVGTASSDSCLSRFTRSVIDIAHPSTIKKPFLILTTKKKNSFHELRE